MRKPIADPTIRVRAGAPLQRFLQSKSPQKEHKIHLLTRDDLKVLETCSESVGDSEPRPPQQAELGDNYVDVAELYGLYKEIGEEPLPGSRGAVYLHELLEGSAIVLPENEEIPRNQVLEARCQKLRAQQENKRYKQMTKDVDNVCKRHPDDSIAYQMKAINRQLIAVFQFVVSVLAGFAFGFIGVELMVGSLDFGFRLLLGIICALVIALAELYFLAKKLSEDMTFESKLEEKKLHAKLD